MLGRGDDVLLSEVCEEVYAALRTEPTVLVVEDLHWVDAASVDVLRFLARRIESMPLALIVTYRDRRDRAAALGSPAARRLRRPGRRSTTLALQPLSVDAVALAARRHRRSTPSGCTRSPAATRSSSPRSPRSPTARCPPRSATPCWPAPPTSTPHDFEVLQLVAAAPDRLDDRVLPALGVDLPTLRRLRRDRAAHPHRRGHRLPPRAGPAGGREHRSRPAAGRGCTRGSSTPWSGSSRATPPCSPTTPSPPATRARAASVRPRGRGRTRPGPARTARPPPSSRSRSSTSTRRPARAGRAAARSWPTSST